MRGEIINCSNILFERPERKRQLGRRKLRYDDNIKMAVTEIWSEVV
jgi:hypothetical protein